MKYTVEYLKQSYYYRGWIISEFASLEKQIETFIMKEMDVLDSCGYEMQTIILDRLTFEAKRASLKTILEDKFNRAGFQKTTRNSYPFKSLLIELNQLNELRNQFAHYTLRCNFYPEEKDKEFVISLAKYRDQFSFIDFTRDDIEKILVRIVKANEQLENYLGKVNLDNNLPF